LKRTQLHLLLLAVCGALVYANALSGPFIFDDEPAIERNPAIRQLWPPHWALPGSGLHAATNSRPLTSAALPHLHRVVELAPELAAARNNLGIALQLAGRRDEAVIQFRRALALRPDYADARANLAAA
jgi:tetratricopeptide (TPR) repeat protein